MKKKSIFLLSVLALASVALTACDDDYYDVLGDNYTVQPEFKSLRAWNSEMYFGAEGGSQQTEIVAAGTGWKITPAANWVKISPSQGEANSTAFETNTATVTFTTDANPEAGDPRVAVNMLESTNSSWKYSTPITVQQAPTMPYVNAVGPTDFFISGKGGEFEISFETNDNWTIYLQRWNSINSWEWMTFEESSGFGSRTKLKGTVSANKDLFSRNTVIYVRSNTNESYQAIFNLTQSPAQVEFIGGDHVTIDNGASELTLKVNSDLPWEASAYNSWLQVSPTTGSAGESTVKIIATPNDDVSERTGMINFTIGGGSNGYASATLYVTQRGLYLNVAGSSSEGDRPIITLPSTDYTANVAIESNTKWKAEVDPAGNADDWLSLVTTSGEGSATLQLKLKDNPNTMGRSAVVRVYVGDSYATSAVRREVLVVQSGKSISMDKSTLNFDDDAATLQVQLTAEGLWTASTQSDWITLNPQSGSTDATLNVTVTENKDDKDRTGLVVVTMADKSLNLTVAQRGKLMLLNDAPLKFGSTGGKGDIFIYTNDKWTASVDGSPDWLSVSPTNGEDSAHVAVTVLSNNYLKERQASVVIASGSGKKFSIPVQQDIRYLRANATSFTFLGDGGQQGPLLITSDGQYTVKNSSAWLSLAKDDASGGYLLTTIPNTDQKQRTDTIVVTCTDLLEGKLELKIPVRQVSNVTDLTLTGYSADGNWNVVSAGGFSVTLTGYKTDKNWNPTGDDKEAFTISRKEYGSDKNWNK